MALHGEVKEKPSWKARGKPHELQLVMKGMATSPETYNDGVRLPFKDRLQLYDEPFGALEVS